MKLQQLRYVSEIVRRGNHLSAAAEALNTSQPGVSRQIQLLETELGFEIFTRTRNRIIGLTEPGEQVLAIADRITAEIDALRSLGEDAKARDRGVLTVGTTHTQARYVLPRVAKGFIERYPGVQLVLKQGDPEQICQMVEDGEADLALGPETVSEYPRLVKLPCLELPRSVVGLKGHPIFALPAITLQDIARYPIISYDPRYTGRWKVMGEFKKAGIEPKVILSAIDADVCKTYAAMGLGLAILTSVTYVPEHDVELEARDGSHLFASSVSTVTVRPSTYVRPFVLDFIAALAPHLTHRFVLEKMRSAARRSMAGGD
jgi:LysR family transcriptional regulator, cys regulon transcriptional activator